MYKIGTRSPENSILNGFVFEMVEIFLLHLFSHFRKQNNIKKREMHVKNWFAYFLQIWYYKTFGKETEEKRWSGIFRREIMELYFLVDTFSMADNGGGGSMEVKDIGCYRSI